MSPKTMRKVLALGAVFSVIALSVPYEAVAQERQAEFSGGWSYAHVSDVSIPGGWYVSGNRYLNNWFGIVGEVSGHYKTVSESGVDAKKDFHIFGAGPRFAYRGYPRLTPFVDLLVGGRHGSPVANRVGADASTSVTDFAYQSQFGLAINDSSGGLGLRLSVGDYGIRSEGKWTNDSLFEIGVVIRR